LLFRIGLSNGMTKISVCFFYKDFSFIHKAVSWYRWRFAESGQFKGRSADHKNSNFTLVRLSIYDKKLNSISNRFCRKSHLVSSVLLQIHFGSGVSRIRNVFSRIRNVFSRIRNVFSRIRILLKVYDPTGSGSTTLHVRMSIWTLSTQVLKTKT
jgi:hypothetical protein